MHVSDPDDPVPWPTESFDELDEELTYLQGRQPGRTYLSASFDDDGEPARFVCKVFDSDQTLEPDYDGQQWVLRTSPGGRSQVKLLVRGPDRTVSQLWLVRVQHTRSGTKTKSSVYLEAEHAQQLVELLKSLPMFPLAEREPGMRIDDAIIRDFFASSNGLSELYRRDPIRFRQLITEDTAAQDVIAMAHRREQVSHFRRLLNDNAFFDGQVRLTPRRRGEDVWQAFFEANPWILGVSLSGQLLTAWSDEKLEQIVAGFSVGGAGKRTDALLRTTGVIRSLVFAEFKTHRTELLDLRKDPYRSGCYGPSTDLGGGVAQAQGTVHRAVHQLGERLTDRAADGSEIPGSFSHLIRPRSFLLIGRLTQLYGQAGGIHDDKFRSFELYRRNVVEPEIVTYDELLARAEWHVATADLDSA